MRKSSIFLGSAAIMAALLCLCLLHAARAADAARPAVARRAATVKALGLTDLCLFTDASYTRHLALATSTPRCRSTPSASSTSRPAPSPVRPRRSGDRNMGAWTERQRSILDFALSSLLRRSGKNAALLAVYTGVVFLLASAMFLLSALRREATLVLADAPDVVVQRLVAGRMDLVPVAYAERLRGIRGVREARPRLWATTTTQPARRLSPSWCRWTGRRRRHGRPRRRGRAPQADGGRPAAPAARPRRVDPHPRGGLDPRRGVGAGRRGPAAALRGRLPGDHRHPGRERHRPRARRAERARARTVAAKIAQELPDTRSVQREDVLRTYDAVFGWRGGW